MATQLVAGNTAVIIGALYAGCDCFFGYPITPASEILHDASKYFPELKRNFVQAESEESTINMAYGAASAGHRVLVASSGPGMSLMQEGLSYLAGAELPIVVVDIQRAGPGLGNIGPEQSDYNQACKGGGHGSYKNIVLAPNSVQEMCDFTMQAFELAFKYRNPAMILADGVLGHMVEPLQFPQKAMVPEVDASWAVSGNAATKDNFITSILLNFDELERHNLRLHMKYQKIRDNEIIFEKYMIDDADIILVAYGISSRIAKTTVDVARSRGIKVGLYRPITLYPFPEKELGEIAKKGRRFISIEMSNGQMREDIRLATGCAPVDLVCRYGGNLVQINQIMEKILE
jgi:2-oxoisovalerate ferredoxin oxidoreductase alpha subunit